MNTLQGFKRETLKRGRCLNMNVITGSPPYLFGIGALVCFCLAVRFCCQKEKLGAAALLSGLFLLCVVLAYFPQLDSIKAFSIDVRLKKGLDRAEDLLAQIRKVSIASAKSTYMNTAWSGRYGSMPERTKQKLLDAVNEELQSVGITEEEKKEIVRPYVEFVAFDLYGIFCNSVAGVFGHHHDGPEGRMLANEWRKTLPTHDPESFHQLSNGSAFASYMKKQIPQSSFDADDQQKLIKLAEKIGHIYDDCLRSGGHTEYSLKFVEKYQKGISIMPSGQSVLSSGQSHDDYNILTDLLKD